MGIELVGHCHHDILDVTVIRRRQDKAASRSQNLGCKAWKRPRLENVLNNFGGNDDIKIAAANTCWLIIYSENVKWNVWKALPCESDAVLAWVATYHVKASRRQSTAKRTIAATKIQNTLRGNLTTYRENVIREITCRVWCGCCSEMVS